MTKTEIAIKRIIASRDDRRIMDDRRKELALMVEQHGINAVVAATELKESTINQYLRDQASRISLSAIEQARFVFTHPEYTKTKNQQ